MATTIEQAVRQLLGIVKELQDAYPPKKFTLDGRLLGDIGETIVANAYDVEIYDGLQKHHDGKTSDGRLVQIKATMKASLTFPADHVPDFYLGIKILQDGSFVEVFNGPGAVAHRAVKDRKLPKTNLHSISVSALLALTAAVPEHQRIPLRDVLGERLRSIG